MPRRWLPLALALAAVPLAGCALQTGPPVPATGGEPPSCRAGEVMHFTNAIGVVGMASYDGVREWAQIHTQLEEAGYDMHPEPTAVAGRDLAGDWFAMTSTGTYEVYYPWNASAPWPSDEASARVNATWRDDASARFDDSVAAFEAATGMRATERGWRPDLQSGTATCA